MRCRMRVASVVGVRPMGAGHVIVLRYHEIALKGRNRPFFVRRLVDNIVRAAAGLPVGAIARASARLLLPLGDVAAWPEARARLARVFGLANLSLAHEVALAGEAGAALERLGARIVERLGCAVDFVHFHSAPFHDRTSQEKARQIAAELVRWELDAALHLVAFGEVQRQIVAAVGRPLRVVLYRRMMLRIAEAIGRPAGAEALVTGESLGQVASQTLPNLAVIEAAVPLPVLRPLIGMDKGEISAEAARLGTFETSIIPDQDCCQLFVPPHPATRAHPEDVAAAEARLDVPALVALGVAGTERVRLCYPAEPAEPPALSESVNESPPVARRPMHPASRRCSSSP